VRPWSHPTAGLDEAGGAAIAREAQALWYALEFAELERFCVHLCDFAAKHFARASDRCYVRVCLRA
jgi:uncharacterized NAD(P)/FAD-binding protein YdhS